MKRTNSTSNTNIIDTSSYRNNGSFASDSGAGFLDFRQYFQYHRLLIWSLGLDKSPFMKFAYRIYLLYKHNGPTFVVLYTKECFRIVQHFVSGQPVYVTNIMPIGIKRGIPSIIPGSLRLLMHSGDLRVIRGVLTVFSIYRIIRIPSVLKLNTIIGPFTGLNPSLPKYELLKVKSMLPQGGELDIISWKLLRSAGPNCKISLLGIWLDIKAWSKASNLGDLIEFISYFPKSDFLSTLQAELSFISDSSLNDKSNDLKLGRLAIKEEAAGKARVFAITDSVTQSVMSPLSNWIFDILKRMPTDGTFNQKGPLDRLLSLCETGEIPLEGRVFYSYDLSAATDRLPIILQRDILSLYFGERFSELWVSIMVDRDWHFKDGHTACSYRYAVGQPMGALSSWGMLALTHHYIVLLAARRVGFSSFSHYAILGDDIVIANRSVAEAYHNIMTEILGVEINLSKSLVSEHSFEFAKRLITLKGEVSPLGPRNLLVALKSPYGIPSVLLDLVNKGEIWDEESMDIHLQKIPFVREDTRKELLWIIKGPFGFIPTASGLTASMKLTNSLTCVRMNMIIDAVQSVKHSSDYAEWESSCHKMIELRISLSEIAIPVGFIDYPIPFAYSPVMVDILKGLSRDTVELGLSRPVRRFIFGGPLIMTNMYREGYMKEIVDYITSLIREDKNFVIYSGDPFQPIPDNLISKLNRGKGPRFFAKVKSISNREISW